MAFIKSNVRNNYTHYTIMAMFNVGSVAEHNNKSVYSFVESRLQFTSNFHLTSNKWFAEHSSPRLCGSVAVAKCTAQSL